MHSLTVLFAVPVQLTENVVVDGIEVPASTSAVPKDPDAAPMVQLCAAQLQEDNDELDQALETYRLLLKNAIGGKILIEARQGIDRIH